MMQDTTEIKPKISKMSGYISFNMVLCFVKKGGDLLSERKEQMAKARLSREKTEDGSTGSL